MTETSPTPESPQSLQPADPARDVAEAVIAVLRQHGPKDTFCLIVTTPDHPEIESGLYADVLQSVQAWRPSGHTQEWPSAVVGYRVSAGTPGGNTGDSAGSGDDD